MTTTKAGEVMREIAAFGDDTSPTAASAFNPLYGASGVMTYRCTLRDGGFVDVDAATGDEAALKANAKSNGGFVTSVNPAPQG